MYSVTTFHVFSATKKKRFEKKESVTNKRTLESASKEAKRLLRKHKCSFHPNMGYAASLVKDGSGNLITTFVAYRDGIVQEMKPKL